MSVFVGYSQKGPGGVSYDSDNQKNCRLWLDAGDLTQLADEDSVLKWYDKSVSLIRDSAFWDTNDHKLYRPPVFRNAPSAGINGKPAIIFNGASMLTIGTWNGNNGTGELSIDLNSNPGMETTYEQTMFFVFRTSTNITDRQILWEEGGSNRGFNIIIVDGNIQIGAYDDTVDKDNGSTGSSNRVPKFGYTYKQMAIQPNTTYVLSFVYNVPKIAHGNVLITNTFNPAPHLYTGMTGTLNGQSFPMEMLSGGQHALGVGGVFTHPDPIGIGGLKRTSFDESGRLTGSKVNGTRLYEGKIAEICYYAFAMNNSQRIIVENYLAAKYFANVIENDKFEYKNEYGHGVIGIGQEQPGDFHDISQGDNIFEIKAANFATAFPNGPPSYVLTGHNNRTLSWTTTNTPDSTSIQRLRRTWRWNVTGVAPTAQKKIRITLRPDDMNLLPPLPEGYSKYGVLIGDGTQVEPNFGNSYSEVIELIPAGAGTFYADVDIKKGTYFTFCAIKPTVQFRLSSDFTIEGDVGVQNKMAEVYLNYKPAPTSTYTVNFNFLDGTAMRGPDYQWNQSTSPLTFTASMTSRMIPFQIINDVIEDDPAVKTFTITLTGASPGLTIGERYELVYTIFDNDPPPKAGFAEAEYYYNEGDGQIQIPVQIFGALSANATVKLRYVTGSGTATRNVDFTVNSPQTLSFNPSTTTAYFNVNLIDDILHEDDEYFEIEIFGANGVGFGPPLYTKTKVYIQDNDNPPTVSFVVPESEGFRIITDPQIQVHLSAPSAKQILVPYIIAGGTAINEAVSTNGDYAAAPEGGTLVFNPGDTVKVLYQNANDEIGIHVYATGSTAIDDIYRTIIFELDDNPTNATAGTLLNHTYIIKDYTEFEWQGLAGIGKLNDNTIWMAPDAATSGSNIENIPNLSPRNIHIFSDAANRRPTVTTSENGRNNRKLISFNGTTHHLKVGGVTSKDEGRSGLVNEGAFYDNKSFFFVFSPENVTSTTPQIIYEQGGGERGMSIYILGNKLYFMAWISKDDGEYAPWGLDNSDAGLTLFPGTAYIQSTTNLVVGEFYVVSCHYGRRWGFTPETEPPFAGLHMYINGKKEASYPKPAPGSNQNDIGRLYKHGGRASMGSAWHQTKVHDRIAHGPKNTNQMDWFFKGKIGEFLYYNEPIMNPARAHILHNYLSAMYNIPLVPQAQVFDLNFANNTTSATHEAFNHQLAGIGRIDDYIHGDAQGSSELRVRNAQFNPAVSEAFLIWGNNGEALTNTWPASAAHLPPGILERSGKVWKFSAKPANGIQNVDISIRYNNVQNASAFSADEGILKLLVSNHPTNFSNATIYNVSNIESGYIAKFANIPITDGMYIALANTSAIFPLPVELLNFDAQLNENVVDINWSTASEHNNDYFEVERAGEDLKWITIAKTQGAGNSNTRLFYSEKDKNPLKGISYYRLKQVDYDGNYKYSDIVSVINHTAKTTRSDMIVYPNPSTQSKVFIQIPMREVNSGKVAIYNLSGTKVYENKTEPNTSLIQVSCGDLPAGIYLIEFQNPEFYGIKKWILNK